MPYSRDPSASMASYQTFLKISECQTKFIKYVWFSPNLWILVLINMSFCISYILRRNRVIPFGLLDNVENSGFLIHVYFWSTCFTTETSNKTLLKIIYLKSVYIHVHTKMWKIRRCLKFNKRSLYSMPGYWF